MPRSYVVRRPRYEGGSQAWVVVEDVRRRAQEYRVKVPVLAHPRADRIDLEGPASPGAVPLPVTCGAESCRNHPERQFPREQKNFHVEHKPRQIRIHALQNSRGESHEGREIDPRDRSPLPEPGGEALQSSSMLQRSADGTVAYLPPCCVHGLVDVCDEKVLRARSPVFRWSSIPRRVTEHRVRASTLIHRHPLAKFRLVWAHVFEVRGAGGLRRTRHGGRDRSNSTSYRVRSAYMCMNVVAIGQVLRPSTLEDSMLRPS